jgi:transcriptional regulator with XRE-family HTH domain
MSQDSTREPPVYPIGQRIRHFRELKGISTNKLANLSGISQSYLRDVELEKKNPTIEIIYQLCESLGISLKDFFDDETSGLLDEPLIKRIYQLNQEQRNQLLSFLNTMID